MFENASQHGSQNRLKILKIDEKTHLGTPGTAKAHFCAPGEALGVPPSTKTHQNQPKTHIETRKRTTNQPNTRIEKRTPEKKGAVRKRSGNTRRWPKFSTAAVTPLGVAHKNCYCEVVLPATPPEASCCWKSPERGGLGEAHLD